MIPRAPKVHMRRAFALLPLILSLAACQTLARSSGVAGSSPRDDGYPALFVNGRPFNSAIRNFRPPTYGLGEAGGCIVMGEFHVVLTDLALDGTGVLRLRGTVALDHPGTGLVLAQIREQRKGSAVRVVRADGTESFDLVAPTGKSAVVALSALGFRTLEIDLNRLARAARKVESFDDVPVAPVGERTAAGPIGARQPYAPR
jgi:hypothetical protein